MATALNNNECLPPSNIGIYIIVSSSWRVYVGQSTNLKKRKYDHIRTLRNGTHSNKILQASFDKYGYLAFKVVEHLRDPARLTEREQFWMDRFQAYGRGMNLTPAAGSTIGCVRTDEQRAKISEITSEFWGKEENRKAQSERKKKFHEKNPEHLKLMSELTKERLKERPELAERHSAFMKERSSTDEAKQQFKDRMSAWRATLTPEEIRALGRKSVDSKGEKALKEIGIRGAATRHFSRRAKPTSSTGVLGVTWTTGVTRSGVPRLDATARWTEPDGTNKFKKFSVAKYGLLPAFKMACEFREKVNIRLDEEYRRLLATLE